MIVATYRHDEVTARHPLMVLMGDLATVPEAERMLVPPLTSAVSRRSPNGPASPWIRQRCTSAPVAMPSSSRSCSRVMGRRCPSTVSDAIIARVTRLPPAAQDVASAAAILGTTADATLIAAVAGRDLAAVDSCADAGVLVRQGSGFGFRHELARQAVENGLSAIRRRQLHGRALRELTRRTPEDHRRLAHHAVGCGDDRISAARGDAGCAQSCPLSAHREAAEHYRTALHFGPAGPDRADCSSRCRTSAISRTSCLSRSRHDSGRWSCMSLRAIVARSAMTNAGSLASRGFWGAAPTRSATPPGRSPASNRTGRVVHWRWHTAISRS